jgi:ABC-2 type transport system ATP-binding protein
MRWGVSDVTVRYGARSALSRVRIEVPAGSITAVVGADGAGKTTLLKVLAGAREPDDGVVRRPPAERLGFVSTGSGSYPDLTVEENLGFAAAAYSVPDAEQRFEELLSATGLVEARHRLGGQLSGGMRQKLGVAMALTHRPELLILDEPTTGLDPVSRLDVWGLMMGAAADGAAVLLSTAYLEEAERAASILVLDDGQALVVGSPDEVLASVPGAVLEAKFRPGGMMSWRRGSTWRAWSPDGASVRGARAVPPDLEDAVMVAALDRRAA